MVLKKFEEAVHFSGDRNQDNIPAAGVHFIVCLYHLPY